MSRDNPGRKLQDGQRGGNGGGRRGGNGGGRRGHQGPNPLGFLFGDVRERLPENVRPLAYRISGYVRNVCAPVMRALAAGKKSAAMKAAMPLAALALSGEDMDEYMARYLQAVSDSGSKDADKAAELIKWAGRLRVPGLLPIVGSKKGGALKVEEERWFVAAKRLIVGAIVAEDDRLEALACALVRNEVCRDEDVEVARERGEQILAERKAEAEARAEAKRAEREAKAAAEAERKAAESLGTIGDTITLKLVVDGGDEGEEATSAPDDPAPETEGGDVEVKEDAEAAG